MVAMTPSARIRSSLSGFARVPANMTKARAAAAAGVGQRLAEVARARGDHLRAGRQRGRVVIGTATLEAANRVQRLHLDDQAHAERRGQRFRNELRRGAEHRIDNPRRFSDAVEAQSVGHAAPCGLKLGRAIRCCSDVAPNQ